MGEDNILVGDEYERTIFESLGTMAKMLLQVHGEKIVQIDADTDEKQTGYQVLNRSMALARWMRSKGLVPGDTISISSENSLQYCVTIVAAYLCGCTFAPLNPDYTPIELNHVVNLSKPKIIFCTPSTIGNIRSASDKFPYVQNLVLIGDNSGNVQNVVNLKDILKGAGDEPIDEEFEVANINPDEAVATVLCSSGTTGLPKGVMATHANMTCFMEIGRLVLGDVLENNENRVSLGLTPFFHSLGFMYMFCNLLAGNLIIVIKKFKPIPFLQSIEKYKVTNLVVPPPIVLFIVKYGGKRYDMSSLTDVRTGAAPMSKEMEMDIKDKLNLHHTSQGYGMTETTLGVLISRTGKSRVGSVGQLVPGMMAKVTDEDGKALGPNKEGEIRFKGPLIMKGYIGNEKATRDTIDQDGWLRTGDVAYYDEDGYFFIVDRIKELIKYKAFQVAPAELEGILLTHDAVIDAAVIGLPDEEAGELPLAFIVKRPDSNITEKELENFIAGQVSKQKFLRGGVHFIDEIPKNPTGKILRRVLRERAVQLKKSKL